MSGGRWQVSGIMPHVSPRQVAIGIGLMVLLTIVGWWYYALRDNGTLVEIQRRGAVRVGLDASFPPFEAINGNNQIVGLDVDIARAVAADLGADLELVNIGFDGLYDALLARRVDLVISGLPYDPRWTQDVAYTTNYFNAGQVLVTPVNNSTLSNIDDITGHTVAVEWGSQADMEARQLAKETANITLLRRSTADEALTAVLNGEADAAIVDGVSGVSAVSQGLQIVTCLTDEWYAAAVHIESRELLKAVNQSLARLEESGRMDAIQERWLYGE